MVNKRIIGIILIMLGIFLLIGLVAGGAFTAIKDSDIIKNIGSGNIYECTIEVKETIPPIGKKDTFIGNTLCKNTGKRCTPPFGIFTEQGVVELRESGRQLDAKDFDTDFFALRGTDTVTLEGCSIKADFTAVLKDEEGDIIDEKKI